MYLGRIVIGERAYIGLLSVVAPGTEVLADTRMGANSSSWEQKDSRVLSLDEEAPRIREPHWLVLLSLTLPIYFVAWLVSILPWLLALYPVLQAAPQKSTIPLRVILNWYQGSPQVAYNYLLVGGKVVFGPVISFGFAVFVRYLTKAIWGDLPTDPAAINGHLASWRATISKTLFPEAHLFELNELLGHHNEARSAVLRLLGAKVGKRVCWPNMGLSIRDYHLLDVGDDVTFGESCHLLTDEDASGLIAIRSGAVIADHVCILPGVTIGEQTALGFGTLTRRGKHYEDGKTFIGCKNGDVAHSDSFGEKLWAIQSTRRPPPAGPGGGLQQKDSGETLVGSATGTAQMEEGLAAGGRAGPMARSGSTAQDANPPEHSPYNRAVYMRDAPYHVLTPFAALCFSLTMTISTSFYWNLPALSAVKLAARFFVDWMEGVDSTYDALIMYALIAACSALLTGAFVVMALATVIVAKRTLVGTFRPGVFDWDKSPYCQRWQLLVSVEKLIRRCFVDKGILSLLTGTHWLVLYYRLLWVKIGRDCALFANGYPSLMITETDLIEMGDRVVIDDVGIITHVDRRGSIRLDRIKIGDGCVLRSGSNILCGAEMKKGQLPAGAHAGATGRGGQREVDDAATAGGALLRVAQGEHAHGRDVGRRRISTTKGAHRSSGSEGAAASFPPRLRMHRKAARLGGNLGWVGGESHVDASKAHSPSAPRLQGRGRLWEVDGPRVESARAAVGRGQGSWACATAARPWSRRLGLEREL